MTHDIIVIGASAGGLQVLREMVAHLPPDLPAAILVVQHIGAVTRLPEILSACGSMPAVLAESGHPIGTGRIHVAPPGVHLLVHEDHILLRRGPRENLARPAIDPLFRTAAVTFGGRVIGVILSGTLNDGSAGLRAVKRCGGLAVVQDPDDASFGDMPRNALRFAEVDHIAPASAMAALLTRLVAEPAGETPEIPIDIRLEAAISAQELADMKTEDRLGERSPLSCPELPRHPVADQRRLADPLPMPRRPCFHRGGGRRGAGAGVRAAPMGAHALPQRARPAGQAHGRTGAWRKP